MGGPRCRVCLSFVMLALLSALAFYSVASRANLGSIGSEMPPRVPENWKTQKRFDSTTIELLSGRAVSLNISTNSTPCGFIGNSDIYGLGIRLGVYLQWVASLLSYQLLEDSIDSVIAANWVFLLATMIATLVITAARHSYNTYSAEIMIMLYIVSGELVVCILPIFSEGNSLPSKLGDCGALSTFFAVSLFASWFWFKGVWLLRPTPCGTHFSVLSKASVANSSQIAAPRAVTTIFAIWFGVLWVGMAWNMLKLVHGAYIISQASWRSQNPSRLEKLWAIVMRFLFSLSRPIERKKKHFFLDKGKKWKANFKFAPIFTSSGVALWCLIAIETTLRWNYISGIYTIQSTGQLIPFIIGVGSVLNVLLSLLGIYLEKSEYNPENDSNAEQEAEEGTELRATHGHVLAKR